MTNNHHTRRQVVTAVGVSIVTALAGCSGGGTSTTSSDSNTSGDTGASTSTSVSSSANTGTDTNTEATPEQNGTNSSAPAKTQGSSSGPIQRIIYNRNNIAVTVGEGADINGFTLIGPDGSEVSQHILSGGETKATLSTTKSNGWISPGTYTIHAIKGTQNSVQEQPVELQPKIQIANVKLVSIDPDTEYDTEDPPAFFSTVQVTVENTGTLPTRLTYAGLTQGVLQPNDPPGATGSNGELGTGEVVVPKSTHQFEVPNSPLRYTGSATGGETPGAQQTVVQGADWEEGKKAWCNGKTGDAKLLIKGSNIDNITSQATLEFAGNATRRQAMELDIGCTNVSVVDEWTQNGTAGSGNSTSNTTTSP